MNRKALAIAVGALFAAPAAHAQITFGNDTIGTVQFYGKLYPQFGMGKADGATAGGTPGVSTLVGGPTQILPNTPGVTGQSSGQRNAVDSQNSYLGFRGERKLMEDLKAIWQVEQSINLDNGTGTWSSRNTFAGLSHTKFGTIKLGNMDTVYKEYGDLMAMFGIASGNFISASNVLSQSGIGATNASFHLRRANSVYYETATFAGANVGVMYGPDETRGTVSAGRATNANLWSYGVKWNSEMVYLSLAQEIHNDFFGGSSNVIGSLQNFSTTVPAQNDPNVHSTDRATRASSEIRFLESQRVTLDVSRISYRERGQTLPAPKFESYIRTSWAIGWDGNFGPWGTAIQYVRAGNGSCSLTGISTPCDTVGLQGTMLSAGVRFKFDRQTFVYGIVSKLNNGPSALYDNWANDNPQRGGDIKQAAIGISYSF